MKRKREKNKFQKKCHHSAHSDLKFLRKSIKIDTQIFQHIKKEWMHPTDWFSGVKGETERLLKKQSIVHSKKKKRIILWD